MLVNIVIGVAVIGGLKLAIEFVVAIIHSDEVVNIRQRFSRRRLIDSDNAPKVEPEANGN